MSGVVVLAQGAAALPKAPEMVVRGDVLGFQDFQFLGILAIGVRC
jgi:hypothetical protein